MCIYFVGGLNQSVSMCSIFGEARCKCELSGMPDLLLTFNKPSLLDDCSLHRCVRINRYESERVVSFVPPDGEFTLFTYKVMEASSSSSSFFL